MLKLNDFNLVVTTHRFREEEAHDEILDLLESIGDADAKCDLTEIKGALLVRTNLDPVVVVEKLREIVSSEPWLVRYVLRVIPIMRVIRADQEEISRAAAEMCDRIGSNEKFRITIEKRHSSIASRDIIEEIASRVERTVDLENPDWIILVEVMGNLSGVSVLRPLGIFSSVVEKRK